MEEYEIIRIASTNPFLDPKKLNLRGVVRSGSYFYALVALDDFRNSQDLEDDTLKVVPLWPDNYGLSDEEVSEFAQAVADVTYCKSSNTVKVYRGAVEDLGINENVEEFITANRCTLLDHCRKIKDDIQPVLTSLRNLDFNRISQKNVAVDDEIKNALKTLEDSVGKIYSRALKWENQNPNLLRGTPDKLVNEIGNIHTWIWQVLEQMYAIESLNDAGNAFRRLIDRRSGLLECIDEFGRLLESAIKRYSPELPFFKSHNSNWRPDFNQSLLILNVMLLLLDPLAVSGITVRITEVIKRFDDHAMVRHPDENGGWDRIASFIRKQFPKGTATSNLKEQLDYLIVKLNRVTGNLDPSSKTSQKTPFITNWLLLCAHSGVFAVVPRLSESTDEGFEYFKEEDVLDDLYFSIRKSSLFPGDFTRDNLVEGINQLEFLIQDPGTPGEESESMSQNLTVRQPSKRPSPEPQGPTASKRQNIAVPHSDDL